MTFLHLPCHIHQQQTLHTEFLMLNKSGANQNPDAAESSAPELLERLVRQAEKAGASDIHLQMRGAARED